MRRRHAAGGRDVTVVPNDPLGDRRGNLRFQIIGEFWAMIETERAFSLVNLSLGGALVRSVVPLDVGTIHRMRLVTRTDVTEFDIEVRHVARVSLDSASHYLLGLEFVRMSAEAQQRVASLVDEVESVG